MKECSKSERYNIVERRQCKTILRGTFTQIQRLSNYSTMVFLMGCHLCRVHFHSFRSLNSNQEIFTCRNLIDFT